MPPRMPRTDWPTIEAEVDGRPSWERLKGERMNSFAAFQFFRDMPMISRSFEAVGRKISEVKGLPLVVDRRYPNSSPRPGAGVVTNVRKWAKEYLWIQRVEHFDSFMDKVRIEESKKQNVEMIARHISISGMLQSKAAKALKEMEDGKLGTRDILNYLIKGAELERLTRGEPTAISENKSAKNDKGQTQVEEVEEIVNNARAQLEQKLNTISARNKEKEQRELEREKAGHEKEEGSRLRLMNN